MHIGAPFKSLIVTAVLAVILAGAVRAQSAPNQNLVPQAVPREVMYRLLFREVALVQRRADAAVVRGKPNPLLTDFFRSRLQLTTAQDAGLKQIGLACAAQIAILDGQADAIISATRSQYKNAPRGSPNAMLPPLPQALVDLEAQRTALVLAAADSLAQTYGPSQFAYFESLVRRHVGSGAKKAPPVAPN
jgi:hypothetical protein